MRKRPIELKFRLSNEECDMLREKLKEADMNRNTFLVRLIMGAQIFPRETLSALNGQLEETNRQLRGLATNINQMAKIANTTHSLPASAMLMDMVQDIMMLRKEMSDLWEEVRRILWQS